ncbi:sulfurase : MOSC domain containing protein OS=Rhodopirellula maiorica SM1 GN=RMSM_03240 PE=4 SV=1: MOSC: 3-alpha [Gemmataceae bacterium]|nr:sulfurase : MOSC domain containing protein OS=Rhodopirellula maiorica SM1 GN=RMSM_03240 PE=4 SV=1: MOSC: 3-alpha [Gemmataceae bacterium]VTU00872.1 sulfurase : MOSC domain containing protein OS=Rhodopirellula maiorica SM1 GN=RMSM_03240 PE=4 SV=1: MOSC: 3-alpha [Gemmataceae bacterium]
MSDAAFSIGPPTLLSVQVGLPQTLGGAARPWTTGFIKAAVAGPVQLGPTNLVGDGQADLANHGGPDKAVCVYPAVHYPHWRAELGLPLTHGAFGENFTAGGWSEADVCVGDVWAIGGALVQVSQPRQPCWKLARRWDVKDLALRVQQTGRTGWYFRVLRAGGVEAGGAFALAERPEPVWTVSRANEVMHHRKADLALAAELAAVSCLSASWRSNLRDRVEKGVPPDTSKRLTGP